MPTLLLTHPACLAHDTSRVSPESPERLRAVLRALEGEAFQLLVREEAPEAREDQLRRVHPEAHMVRVEEAIPDQGHNLIDADTVVSPDSYEAALRAAGAVIAGVDAVIGGTARNAFCAVRPPGHHAEPMRAMGFCLFNNVAVGAAHARTAYGLDRVAVLDFDVHHGNGTQAAFLHEAGLFFASTHEEGNYPGTGFRGERGDHGQIHNRPLPPGADSDAFRAAWSEDLLPALEAFEPELVLISAGFDAHVRDPLARLRLTTEDFAWITREIVGVARAACGGRVVSTLEGGYDLQALADSAAAHVHALMTS